jgi:hypothetical protein
VLKLRPGRGSSALILETPESAEHLPEIVPIECGLQDYSLGYERVPPGANLLPPPILQIERVTALAAAGVSIWKSGRLEALAYFRNRHDIHSKAAKAIKKQPRRKCITDIVRLCATCDPFNCYNCILRQGMPTSSAL